MDRGIARGAQPRERVRTTLFSLSLVVAAVAVAFIAGAAPFVTRDVRGHVESTPERGPAPTTPEPGPEAREREGQRASEVAALPVAALAPPRKSAPVVVTMLHGMCSDVSRTCDAVRAATPEGALLSCPQGNALCGESFDWSGEGPEKAAHLDERVGADLEARGFARERSGGDVLMGFSRGAFVARDVALARPGRYKSLVLIGAALSVEPKALAASGVRRVVLASGDHDHAARTMRALHTRLSAAGVESRYVSLGPVYHTLPPDTAERLREALRWAAE